MTSDLGLGVVLWIESATFEPTVKRFGALAGNGHVAISHRIDHFQETLRRVHRIILLSMRINGSDRVPRAFVAGDGQPWWETRES